MAISSDDRRQPSVQVASALRAEIQAGRYKPGDRLPTIEQLAAEYGVAKATVQRALEVLRQEGYIVAWQGRGTFVRDDLPTMAGNDAASPTTIAAIRQRLDEIHDELADLRGRVDRLESERDSRPGN